jgi:hypothetical protein
MTSTETLNIKNVVNKHRFLLVTHTTYFDPWFGPYRFLKSGYSADQVLDQVLDRLDRPVLGQVFGPQEVQHLLGFEYKF